jgi:hypothetical protein
MEDIFSALIYEHIEKTSPCECQDPNCPVDAVRARKAAQQLLDTLKPDDED